MKILICHDGSVIAQNALDKILFLFGALKPKIFLLTVIEESMDASMENDTIFNTELEKRKSSLIKIAESITKHGIEVEVLVYSGGPKKTIIKVANAKQPDLLVVARRSGDPIAHKLFGSTSEFLIKNSKYPVIVFNI